MLRLLFLLCSLPLFGLTLKEQLKEAQPGSYLVTSQDKSLSFLFIRACDVHTLLIEEVTIPASRAPKEWKGWFESGAPGHTLWTASRINLDKGELEATFSFTHEGWIDTSEANTFFATLLNLPLREVPETKRKKIGFPPKYGQTDKRRVWHPPLTVEGKRIDATPFTAYETRWPNDRTELARRHIELYIPAKEGAFFPHWIEVDGKVTTIRLHAIDSGERTHSPKPTLPFL